MKKVTYEEKISTLDRYIERPQGINDPEVLRAVKVDVFKAHSKGVKKGSEIPSQPAEATEAKSENALYNSAMGVYREFVQKQGGYLDMGGRKANANKDAMNEILEYLRGFMRSNNKPHDDAHVLEAIKFMFANWDKLNEWLQKQIMLTQINKYKAEILIKIRNGADKKSAAKTELDRFKESLG